MKEKKENSRKPPPDKPGPSGAGLEELVRYLPTVKRSTVLALVLILQMTRA